MCVAACACLCVCECEREWASLKSPPPPPHTLSSLHLSLLVDRHNRCTVTARWQHLTALWGTIGAYFTTGWEWHLILELWLRRKSLRTRSSFISQIKMINSVTNNATKRLHLSPLNVWIDHTFTTWFVSICCKHKLNQIMHWSCAWGEICHSFVDEDKLIAKSMPTEVQCFLSCLSWWIFSKSSLVFHHFSASLRK